MLVPVKKKQFVTAKVSKLQTVALVLNNPGAKNNFYIFKLWKNNRKIVFHDI